jgi:hypothetical protein
MSFSIATVSSNQEFTGSAALASPLARRTTVGRTRIEVSTRQPREINVALPSGYGLRIILTDDEPDWLYQVLSAIKEFSFYQHNWDSYGGVPTTFVAAYTALNLLGRILPPAAPTPSVVPGSSGSLQLEWHRAIGDLEITVEANGTTSIGFTDAGGQDTTIPVSDLNQLAEIFAAL